MKSESRNFLILLLVSMVLAACGGGVSDQEATVQALGESISLTATAAAGAAFDSGANLEAVQAEATKNAAAAAATQAAEANLSDEARAATATAVAPILAELPTYGVDPAKGHMGWIHPPETIEIDGYLQFDYANRFIGTVGKDFVVSADITWNTAYGTSGCGFVLRSDGNEAALSQYLAIATRGGNGRVIFSSMDKGDVINVIDNYAYGNDPLFDWRNDTTNRLTIVARGDTFTIYTNGTRIGEVTTNKPPVLVLPSPPIVPPVDASETQLAEYQAEVDQFQAITADAQARYAQSVAVYQPETPYFERGFIAMVALSESGKTICHFNNAWLWLIDS